MRQLNSHRSDRTRRDEDRQLGLKTPLFTPLLWVF